MRRWLVGSGVLLCAGLLAGCVAVAAGAAAGYGTAQYVRNDDTRDYAADLAVVWPAAMASMADAGYPVAMTAPSSPTHGEVDVNGAEVEVTQVSPGTTRVRVEIGTFTTEAHRRVSAQVHAGIARRLGR